MLYSSAFIPQDKWTSLREVSNPCSPVSPCFEFFIKPEWSLSFFLPTPLFETGFLCVTLVFLELALQTRLISNSEINQLLPPGITLSCREFFNPNFVSKCLWRAGEMAQWFRALPALPKDPSQFNSQQPHGGALFWPSGIHTDRKLYT